MGKGEEEVMMVIARKNSDARILILCSCNSGYNAVS